MPGPIRGSFLSNPRFLVAQLHINALATKHTRKALRSSIDKLPKKLDTMYEETVRRIYEQNQDDVSLAEKVLSWITFALTPLTVTALQHAVATMLLEEGSNDIDEDDLPDEDVLLAVCAGLVAIEKESNLIRLVHFTTQEYFERNRTTRFANAQEKIAKTCLTYLSLTPFLGGACSDGLIYAGVLTGIPLFATQPKIGVIMHVDCLKSLVKKSS